MNNLGLQLYSLRHEFAADYKKTMKTVADLGFDKVEFAGFGDLSSIEMNELLNFTGITPVSAHFGIDDIENNFDEKIKYLKEIGCSYCTVAWANLENREEAISAAKRLNILAEKCTKEGLLFAYHNHGHEFKTVDDECLYDVLAEHCNELVLLEIDVYWVKQAGKDPIEYIRKYAGRVPLIHVKDGAYNDDNYFENCIVGEGELDFSEIIRVAKMLGTEHFIVEQEKAYEDQIDACKKCIDYLRAIK